MTRRIALWTLCGFAVALAWALTFYLVGPSRGQYPSQAAVLEYLGHSILLKITVPLAWLAGRHYRITWYWSAVINAATYACACLVFESIRLTLRMRTAHPRH